MRCLATSNSNDEELQFKKSATVAAAKDIHLRGVSETSHSMVQIVVDNFDAYIASQNGNVSAHSLANLMTQTVKMESAGDNSRETIK